MLDWIKNKTSKSRKQYGKYNFHVKSEPQHIDSSTTLTLTTYTNATQNATIPCRYRWSIIKNGLTIQVPQFKGSSFKCEPSDVGSLIQAEVISTDPQYGGTAVIQFGPVKLDVTLKKQIQIALSSGCTTMPVYLINNGQQKQCQIRLFEDVIKINHAYSEANYTFDYSIFQPRIECISKDSSRIVVIFNQKYQVELKRFLKKLFDQPTRDLTNSVRSNGMQQSLASSHSSISKLDIKFMNRTSRDIFLFSLKAFNTKKELRSSIILSKIEKIDINNQQTFDYVLQIEGLKSELVKMDFVVKKTHQQKMKYIDQIHRLQKQIEEIILTYTRIVEQKFQNQGELSRDYSMLSQKRDEIIAKKYKNLESENNHLNSRIQTLAKEIDTIRFKPQLSQPLQPLLLQTPHEKVHFNYQPNINAFTKKKSYQDNSGIANILDQLGQSRISYISSIKQKQDPQIKNRLQETQKQKQCLQKKLQMSFHKIDNLEKQLFQKDLLLNSNQNNQKLNNSAIHFTYKGPNTAASNDYSISNFVQQPLYMSTVVDNQKQNLLSENKQLKKSNQFLMGQKKKLIDQLKRSRAISAQKNPTLQSFKHDYKTGLDNSLNFLKTQKKDSTNSQKQKDLIETLSRKQNQLKMLRMQNQELKKQNEKLRKSLESADSIAKNVSLQKFSKQKQKYQRKIKQLEQQIEMYRKNADALNRSQQLSLQMDQYNDQQINMLKQHNQFLTSQNEKLVKACQKYMIQAKQANKLRMQILRLKQRINELQLLNGSSMAL